MHRVRDLDRPRERQVLKLDGRAVGETVDGLPVVVARKAARGWKSPPDPGDDVSMFGPIAIVIILIVGIPVSVMMSGAIASALIGWLVSDDVNRNFQGSELLETNR